MTIICSLLHLLVDGLCVCCLYMVASAFSSSHLVGIFLTYNILAFLTQPLTGIMADRIERKHWLLLESVLLLTMACLATSIVVNLRLSTYGMMIVAILLGTGNSLFHVWGGKQVAVNSSNDIRALGTFVSTGAFGLSLGIVFFSWPLIYVFLISICLLSVVYLNLDFKSANATSTGNTSGHRFGSMFVCLSLLTLMLAVMLRSHLGETFTGGVPKSTCLILLIGFLSMLGKMAGGWLVRYMGIVRMLVLVVLLTVVCFVFRSQGLTVLLLGLFAVNCTMPLTLYLANLVLPRHEGLAFGLLAAALIPGYLLAVDVLW